MKTSEMIDSQQNVFQNLNNFLNKPHFAVFKKDNNFKFSTTPLIKQNSNNKSISCLLFYFPPNIPKLLLLFKIFFLYL